MLNKKYYLLFYHNTAHSIPYYLSRTPNGRIIAIYFIFKTTNTLQTHILLNFFPLEELITFCNLIDHETNNDIPVINDRRRMNQLKTRYRVKRFICSSEFINLIMYTSYVFVSLCDTSITVRDHNSIIK